MFGFKKTPVVEPEPMEPDAEPLPDRSWSYSEGGSPGELIHFFRPGEPNRRHVLTLVVATLRKGGIQLLTIQDEGHMALRSYCHNSLVIERELPIRVGKAVQVTLNCYQDTENVASLTVWGYTEDRHPDEDDVLP